MDNLRERRNAEHDPDAFVLGKVWSGETVVGNLFDPEINIPDSDLLKQAGFLRADLIRSALTWVDARGEGYESDIVWTHEFDDELGTNDCLPTEPSDEIIYAFRPSRKRRRTKPTRFVLAREGRPSKHVTVILRRTKNNPQELSLVAAWIGKPAKPEPVGPFDTQANQKFWRNHGLALRDLGQIDTDRPIYRSHNNRPGREMSLSELNHLVEEEERKFAVRTTVKHMLTGQFGPRFVEIHTEPKRRAIAEIDERTANEARTLAEDQIEVFAASCLVITLAMAVEEDTIRDNVFFPLPFVVRSGTRKWKRLINATSRQETDNTILAKRLTKANLEELKEGDEYLEAPIKARQDLEQAQQEVQQQVNKLLKELESRKNEQAVIDAARSWTNAPDSDGLIGRSGRGFSGGLVHFFEYRSGITKRERFKTVSEPMSMDGFITFTNRLKVEVAAAESLLHAYLGEQPHEPSPNYVVVLKDARENKRFYILKPNNDLILAYQKPGQDIKLSTMVTDSSIEYVDKVVEESIRGEDRGRINKLGPKVRCVMRQYPPEPEEEGLAA